MNNNPYNPQMPLYGQQNYYNNFQQQQQPHYEIIKVNGKPGVDAFRMGPNSSIILVDETTNLVWFVRTDGAGYKEATPFTITHYVEQPPVDLNVLMAKVQNLENMVAEMKQNGGNVNEQKSDS